MDTQGDRRGAGSAAAALAVVGLGALLSLAWRRLSAGGTGGPAGEPRYFAADRDAGALVVLDRDLFVVRRVPLEFPIELELRRDGRLWVACASAAGPLGPHRLRRIAATGT